MKKYLVLVFAVVILTGINISMAFAYEERFDGKVTSMEYYDGSNFETNLGAGGSVYQVCIEITYLYRRTRNSPCMLIVEFNTDVPADSDFVPILTKSLEKEKEYLFIVDVTGEGDTSWYGKLLGIRPPAENVPDPSDQILNEIKFLKGQVTQLTNAQNSQNRSLGPIKLAVDAIKTNINTVINKLAEIKNLLVSSSNRR